MDHTIGINNLFHNTSTERQCKLPYCQECGGAYKILLIIFMVIVFYFFFLRGSFKEEDIVNNDIFNKKVFDIPWLENCCSVWPISHFVLYFILGILFPDCDVPLISLGILWEGFEMFVASTYGSERQWVRENGNVEYSDNWWAGSLKDIFFNIVGFYTGKLLVKSTSFKACFNNVNSGTTWCNNSH
ncbi:hypothetical protein OAG24_00460 [bacterium]|nr:hypothetical protein [bacterium]